MSFKIIVDSCCDLTPAQLREECFVKVPLTIRVGEHIVVDDASFDQVLDAVVKLTADIEPDCEILR